MACAIEENGVSEGAEPRGKSPEAAFATLMSRRHLVGIETPAAIDATGALIDLSSHLKKPEGEEHALAWCEELSQRTLNPSESALLHYFWANAWSDLLQLKTTSVREVWYWECPEYEGQILHLRLALSSDGFGLLDRIRRCQVLTNLGNTLSHLGRFAEASEYYDRALKIDSGFPMTVGNRGYCLEHYAAALYDPGHARVLLRVAHEAMASALDCPTLPAHARRPFEEAAKRIEKYMGESLTEQPDLNAFPLGESVEEIKYRSWCLANRVFLNPLNDLGAFSIAARDIITTPNMFVPLDEGPIYQGFFNQMKQEFVAARYLYYEGTHAPDGAHYCDKDVLLFNTLDYPTYCIAAERVKAAFRLAYSLFDKIAFFLNSYMHLDVKERHIYFKTIWYASEKRANGLKPCVEQRRNWPLRGLFWVSKDLFESAPGYRSSLEPSARELEDIRQHLEHKYLKLHEPEWAGPPSSDDRAAKAMADTLARSCYRRDFEAKTLRLLKTMRAALIYLALAIRAEENQRAKARKPGAIIPGVSLDVWEDSWKR